MLAFDDVQHAADSDVLKTKGKPVGILKRSYNIFIGAATFLRRSLRKMTQLRTTLIRNHQPTYLYCVAENR